MRSTLLVLLLAVALTAAHAQTFPCPDDDDNDDGSSAGVAGYQTLEPTEAIVDSLLTLANSSFYTWLTTQDNFTICNSTNTVEGLIGLRDACSDESGSTNNTAIQYFVFFDCPVDADTDAEDRIVLDAIFSTPAGGTPQLTQVFQDEDTPAEEIIEEGVPDELVPAAAPAPTPVTPVRTPSTTATPTTPAGTATAPASALRTFSDLNS